MSCNYADGLSDYKFKGVLGTPEIFDSDEDVKHKCEVLAEWIRNAKHVVIHTGAGISTAAGIPDFRGPNGVWTLENKGKKPDIDISFSDAIPTRTHLSLKCLIENNYVHYIISQNIDGLHLRSGVPRTHLAELHGNMFVTQCDTCSSQFVMSKPVSTVGQKLLKENCKRTQSKRPCRGLLRDTILDWEADLPVYDLEISDYQSAMADINICLGTTLQIVPSGNLPLKCKKYGGKVVIVNLQQTKHDKKADLIINAYVDNVMEKLMKLLNLEIPAYSVINDPTKNHITETVIEWNIVKSQKILLKKKFDEFIKNFKENKRKLDNENSLEKNKKTKIVIKKEIYSKNYTDIPFTSSLEFKNEPDKKEIKKEENSCQLEESDCIDLTLDSDEDV